MAPYCKEPKEIGNHIAQLLKRLAALLKTYEKIGNPILKLQKKLATFLQNYTYLDMIVM